MFLIADDHSTGVNISQLIYKVQVLKLYVCGINKWTLHFLELRKKRGQSKGRVEKTFSVHVRDIRVE